MWRLARSLRQGGSSWQLCGAAVVRLTVAAGSPAPNGSPGRWYEWLAQSIPVHWAEDGLVALQAAAGLPWWAAIVCGGALLRSAVTLPLAAHQGRLLAKVGPRAEGTERVCAGGSASLCDGRCAFMFFCALSSLGP